ncbi:MAG: hypothetical protein GY835_03990 [bacterium]|nr:hypothetical protein [bacterium]
MKDENNTLNDSHTTDPSILLLRPDAEKRLGIQGDLHVEGALRVAETISGKLAKGSVGRRQLARGSVASSEIAEADGGKTGQDAQRGCGIKTAHIQDGAITEDKLHEELSGKIFGSRANRKLISLTFSQADEDRAIREIDLGFRTNYVMANGTVTSPFDKIIRPHGGITTGFAELSQTEIIQSGVGPVTHIIGKSGQQGYLSRFSAIAEAPGDSGFQEKDGIAHAVLEFNQEEEVVSVRVKEVSDSSITFELRRAHLIQETSAPPDQLTEFYVTLHVFCFG